VLLRSNSYKKYMCIIVDVKWNMQCPLQVIFPDLLTCFEHFCTRGYVICLCDLIMLNTCLWSLNVLMHVLFLTVWLIVVDRCWLKTSLLAVFNCRVCHSVHSLQRSHHFGQTASVTVIQAWLVSAFAMLAVDS